jgi:6-phosphofructokinase 1
VIVAEGAASGSEIGKQINEETGIDTRVTVLGHVQRGGSPTAHDRIAASLMGYHAVKVLAAGGTNRVICLRNGKYVDMDIEEALAIPYQVCEENIIALEALGSGV